MIDNLLKADVFKELNFGMNTILTFAGFFILVFGINFLFLYILRKMEDFFQSFGKILNLVILTLFISVLGVIAFNSGKIAESDYSEPIPFFNPVYNFFSAGFSSGENMREMEVNYPYEKFADVKLSAKKDILYILVESLRSDVFNEKDMPLTYRFFKEQGCITSKHHHSGELSTIYGVFSFLYGLNIYHYYPFYFSGDRSVPIKILANNGYETLGLAASGLKRWSVHSEVLIDQFDLYKEFRGKEWRADSQMVKWTKKYVEKVKDNRPRFYFMFFNSTHHNYFYPEEFEKNTPVIDVKFNYFRGASLRKKKDEVKNRYLNASSFVDYKIGELLESFQEKINKGDLIVVLSGDHGEEFWDYGSLGHGKISNNARSQVPLMICLPGTELKEVFLSSHTDIFPTIIDYLGTTPELDPAVWSNGISLLGDLPEERYIVVSGFDFPRRSEEVTLINQHGKLFLTKTTSSIDSKNEFKINKRTDLNDVDIEERKMYQKLDPMVDKFSLEMNKFFK
jgi:membrane-anchored protein YejM (alkaline phosphatase superfamily)